MGYSCTAKASYVSEALLVQLQAGTEFENKNQNSWSRNSRSYFFEIGREQPDGSVTGIVWALNADGKTCRKAGSAKIAADGSIPYFPTSTRAHRESAVTTGLIKFHEVFGGRWEDGKVLYGLVGDAKFVVI